MSAAPKKTPAWRKLLDDVGAMIAAYEPSPRMRKGLRLGGYPAFGFLVALMSFSAAIPRDKVREQLETMLSQDPGPTSPIGLGMDVKAGELDASLLGSSLKAENVVLRTRPLANAKPARFVLDTVKVSVGLLGLAFQRPTYAFQVDAFEGHVSGRIRAPIDSSKYNIEGNDLHLGDIQGLQSAVGGLPLEGTLEGKLELDAPGRLLATSNGSVEVTIEGAALGDGKAKLSVPNDPFLSAGITVPKVRLGNVQASITIEKGRARIDNFRAHSGDLDLTIEGYVDLRDPLSISMLHLFIRFKLSDELLKREPTLGIVTTGLQTGKRGDGFFGAQLTGSMSGPRFEPNKSPPAGVTSKFEGGAATPAPPATPAAPATTPAAAAPTPAPTPAVVDAATAPPAPAPELPERPTIPNNRVARPPAVPPSATGTPAPAPAPAAPEGETAPAAGTAPPPAPANE